MRPVVMLPRKYKSRAAAQRAVDAMGRKLGVAVGAQLSGGGAGKKKNSKRKKKKGPVRSKSGRFVSRKRSKR